MTRYNQVIVKQGAIPTAERDIYRDRFHEGTGPTPLGKSYGSDLPWKNNFGVTHGAIQETATVVRNHFTGGAGGINTAGSPPVMNDSEDDDPAGDNTGGFVQVQVSAAARMEQSIRSADMYAQVQVNGSVVKAGSDFIFYNPFIDSPGQGPNNMPPFNFNPNLDDLVVAQIGTGEVGFYEVDLFLRCTAESDAYVIEDTSPGTGTPPPSFEESVQVHFNLLGSSGNQQGFFALPQSVTFWTTHFGAPIVSLFNHDSTFNANPSFGLASTAYQVDDGPLLTATEFRTQVFHDGFTVSPYYITSFGTRIVTYEPPPGGVLLRAEAQGSKITAIATWLDANTGSTLRHFWWCETGDPTLVFDDSHHRRVGIGQTVFLQNDINLGDLVYIVPPYPGVVVTGNFYHHTSEYGLGLQNNVGLDSFEAGVLKAKRPPANTLAGLAVAQQLRTKEQVKQVSQTINAAAGSFFG